ncbi:MAG: alanine racemase [Halioglobus sp.]
MARPNQARLDLDALRANLAHARSLSPHSKVMAVIKANAYGHGAVAVGHALEASTDAFAVACIEEALELRGAGITAPILLLQGIFETAELALARQHNFWLMIENEWQLQTVEDAVPGAALNCWLKIDTGMHRLGIDTTAASAFYQRLKYSENVTDEIVVCSHFASADDLESDQTRLQIECFEAVTANFDAPRSLSNSPALLGWPASRLEWIRPGYMLYGNSPFGNRAHPSTDALRPVMTLTSSIISVREVATGEPVGYAASWVAKRPSRIATVTIGYGDGYPRLAKNGTPVLIKGQRAPLAGRVSMDMITVDVTDLENVQVGDKVTLWGEGLPVGEVAEWADTIGYELTTRMPMRTPRVVTKG